MNDPNEPSYYEIALTRRQVTVAFVVLLVCMILSFLAGVWTVRAGLPAQAVVAATTPTEPVEGAEGAKLPEYQFFNDGAAAKGAAKNAAKNADDVAAAPAPASPVENTPQPPAAIGPTDQTLLADIGGTEEAAPAEPGAPSPEDSEASAPSSTAAASPLPPIRSSAPAAPAPAASPLTDGSANGSVYRELGPGEMAVQVFSSTDEKQARAILRQLRAAGYEVFLTPGTTGASRMFRVRIGPYTDRAVAQKVADDVKRRFKFDPWIAK